MAKLSITQAWNETAAFVAREARLLFPIAFLLVALPGAVVQLMVPEMARGQWPEPGAWMLVAVLAGVGSLVGNIAIAFLALSPGASVAEALQRGLRRFLYLFAAAMLVALAFALVMVPLVIIVGAGTLQAGGSDNLEGAALLVVLLMVVIGLAIWPRLVLMTPIAAAESVGPVKIVTRSWALTRGHFWRLLGFLLLLLIAAAVVMMAVSAVFGIFLFMLAGPPEPGTSSAYVMAAFTAILQSIFAMVAVTLVARLYVQLSGGAA